MLQNNTLLIFSLCCFSSFVCGIETPLLHGHLVGKVVQNCPKKICKIDPKSKLYYWKYIDQNHPTMELTTWDNQAVPLHSVNIDFNQLDINPLLKDEIEELAASGKVGAVEVSFSPDMEEGKYILMFHNANLHQYMANVNCEKEIVDWWKPWKKKLNCNLKKKEIEKISL